MSVSGKTLTVSNTGVYSFNGLTGAVQGVSSANGLTGAVTFIGGRGITHSVSSNGISFSVNFRRGGLTFPSSAIVAPSDILLLQTFGSTATMYTATVNDVITSNVVIPEIEYTDTSSIIGKKLILDSNLQINSDLAINEILSGTVTSINGRTGAIQGVSAAVGGTGISVSGATGSVTITNTGVLSFNNLTGNVSGLTIGSLGGTQGSIQFKDSDGLSGSSNLTFQASAAAGSGATASYLEFKNRSGIKLYENPANGNNFISFIAPSSITDTSGWPYVFPQGTSTTGSVLTLVSVSNGQYVLNWTKALTASSINTDGDLNLNSSALIRFADGTTQGTAAYGVVGGTGATGATGATGPTGADSTVAGPRGTTGATGATGATGPVGDYVISFNGLSGAVTGVTTGTANNFIALQTFSAGISASGGITFNGGKVWTSANDGANSGLDADALRGVSGDRFIEEIQTGLLYGGVLSINAGNTAAVDVSAGAGIIVTVNAATGGYPAPTLQTIQWTAKTGVTLAGMTSSDFTFFRIDSSGNLQQASNNFTQTEYLNSIIIGNAVHQSRAFVNRVHYHPIVAYASSPQYETFIRYFGPLKVDGYVMSGFGVTGGIQHTTGTAFALGANMDTDVDNPSLVTDSSSVPVQQLFYLFRNADGTYRTDPTARTTVNFGNYDDGDGTLGNVGNQSWSIQRVYKIPGLNNALYIYYGHAVYSSLTVAKNNVLLESFAEADITRYNGVFLGWLVVRGNGSNVSSSGDCLIIPGGFFRNTTGGGGASTQLNLDDLGDVAITSVANNEILRYDGTQGLWVNSAVTTLPLVTSFNGLTGAVTGVTTGTANTFVALQSFTTGISASGGVTLSGTLQGTTANFTGLVSSTVGFSGSGTNLNNIVKTINGLSGGVTFAAGTNITLTPVGNTITIASSGGGGGSSVYGVTASLDFSENINGLEIVISGTGESLSTSLQNIEKLRSIDVTLNAVSCTLVSIKSFYNSGWCAKLIVKPPFAGGSQTAESLVSFVSSVDISGYSGQVLVQDTWTNVDSSNIYHQEETYVIKTLTGITWVSENMFLSCKVLGLTSADHTPEDAILEGVNFEINNILGGTGFDIIGHAPEGTYGKYTVKCLGQ